MALHDELAALRTEVGGQVFDDPVAFRAAFDDFIPEGSASTGEVSLLVGAIATGAFQRLSEQLALGADPETAIATQGDLMARDRGTSEASGARWALAVLAHATGSIPAASIPTRPTPAPGSVSEAAVPATAARPVSPASDGDASVTRAVSADPPPPTTPAVPARRSRNPLLIGAVAVLAIVAVVSLVLLLTGGEDEPTDTTADDPASTSADVSGGPVDDVLDEVEVSEAGKTVRLQLVRSGEVASVVLLVERDGELTETDRVASSCPYLETAHDPGLLDQGLVVEGNPQFAWGWANRGTAGHGEYGQILWEEDLLDVYGVDPEDCPAAE